MFISVDLPEPDGAHDGDELAGLDGQADAGEGAHLDLAHAVDLDDIVRARRAAISEPAHRAAGHAGGVDAVGLVARPITTSSPSLSSPSTTSVKRPSESPVRIASAPARRRRREGRPSAGSARLGVAGDRRTRPADRPPPRSRRARSLGVRRGRRPSRLPATPPSRRRGGRRRRPHPMPRRRPVGRKRSAAFGTRSTSRHGRDLDRDVGGHLGPQPVVRVRHLDDHRVGDDVLVDRGVEPDLRDACRGTRPRGRRRR